MFLWLLLFKQWARLRPLYLPSGVLLALALTAPRHILVAERNPTWAHFYFIQENWERFTLNGHGRYQPWWFVPIVLLGTLFPGTGFLWSALRETSGRRLGAAGRRPTPGSPGHLGRRHLPLLQQVAVEAQVSHILPLLPLLAVLIGTHLARAQPKEWRVGLVTFRCLCGLLVAAALVAVLKPGLIRDLGCRPRPTALCLWLGRDPPRRAELRPWRPAALFPTAVLFMAGLTLAEPLIPLKSSKPLALEVARQARPGDLLYTYHEFFHDFAFYAGRTVGIVSFKGELEPEKRSAGCRGAHLHR